MKRVYFFIHIPKTAGTSFRTGLQQNPAVHMLYDYGKKNSASSPELMDVAPQELLPENNVFQADKHNFLCGS
jgi:hypothetical protein